jgi:hypothetical protein
MAINRILGTLAKTGGALTKTRGALTKVKGSFGKGKALGPSTRKAIGGALAQGFITKTLGPVAGDAVAGHLAAKGKKKKKNGKS